MSELTIAQGDFEDHEVLFRDRVGGNLVDDDRYATTGQLPVATIVTPSGGANPPTLGTIVRLGAGYYRVRVTTQLTSTLSSLLVADWILRYTLRINGQDKAFDYDFIVTPSGASEAGSAFYNTFDDFRRSIADRYEVYSEQTVSANGALNLGFNTVRVMTVAKNNSVLAAGVDYTFQRPSTLRLVAGLTASDTLEVRASTYFEDDEIRIVATESKNWIDTRLTSAFTLPFVASPPRLKDIERQIVRGRVLLEYGPRYGLAMNEEDRKMAYGWIRSAKDELGLIAAGNLPLIGADGVVIEPVNDVLETLLDIQTDADA